MQTLDLARGGDIAWLRLDRPDKLNSFTPVMWQEMRLLGREIKDDPSIRALVVIGNGRAFSSGIDTSVFTGGGSAEDVLAADEPDTHDDPSVAAILRAQDSYTWLEEARYPTIAAVPGHPVRARLPPPRARGIRL